MRENERRQSTELKKKVQTNNGSKDEQRNHKIAYFLVLLYVRGNNTIEGKKNSCKNAFSLFLHFVNYWVKRIKNENPEIFIITTFDWIVEVSKRNANPHRLCSCPCWSRAAVFASGKHDAAQVQRPRMAGGVCKCNIAFS